MAFNKFNIIVFILVILIAFTGSGMVWAWTTPELKIAKFTITIVWGFEIYILLRYVNKTNKQLKLFLERINYTDILRSNVHEGKIFKELNLTYNEIIRYIKLAQLEKENTGEYFRNAINIVPSGIMSVNKNKEVEIVNQAALSLFGISSLKNIEELNQRFNNFGDKLLAIRSEKQQIIEIEGIQDKRRLLVRQRKFRLGDRNLRLISLQSIHEELEREEANAWKKIFRVLTHEIMNSVGPIRSLTSSVLRLFLIQNRAKKVSELNDLEVEYAVDGLKSIENRNKGLLKFVEDFKKLNRLPDPVLKNIEINSYLTSVEPFFNELFANTSICFEIKSYSKEFFVKLDEKQITQVLINLLKNAKEAVEEKTDGQVSLQLEERDKNLVITVSDNGKGITDELQEQVFVPFFTTKKEGSGIGLGLSRQIIWNHGGKLFFESNQYGTRFFIIMN